MDRSKLADLSEIVSSIAIVFTLIFLTVEVRQNTNALHAESRQSVLDAAQVELYFQAEHPGIVLSAIKTGPLSVEENISLDAVLAALMRGREYSWLQYQDGAIDERQWRTEFLVTVSVMDSDRNRKWWSILGHNAFSEEYIEFVESEILSVPVTENGWNVFAEWANR